MKKFYFLLMLLFAGVTNNLHAQENGVYDITVTAMSESSGIHAAIGEANLASVRSLKVTGTINGYDVMIIRNKMTSLNTLDLSDASIVASEYYSQEENVLSNFNDLTNLTSVKVPRTITKIKESAFYGCKNLTSVTLYPGLEDIEKFAFEYCDIRSLVIPEGVKVIMNSAFAYNYNLSSIVFPSSLEEIKNAGFIQAAVELLNLPVGLKIIGSNSFEGCTKLREVRIPSTVTKIENYAFAGTYLNDIYVYTIEPAQIGVSFDATVVYGHNNYSKATLHVPTASYYKYYWDASWSKFQNIVEHNEEYTYFYINTDLELSDKRINGEPDADLNAGSGLIIEGTENQNMDDISLISDDEKGGSLITDGNVVANSLRYDIKVLKNKWYFFCFPSRIQLADVHYDGQYVFRYYDGAERATNGNGGWKDLPGGTEYLEAQTGYIFQGSANGTLSLLVQTPDFSSTDKQESLTAHAAADEQNAGWNLVGNPHMSYFDINDTGFTSAFTVWNGTTYEAYRAGDDIYHFHPFQAFFVQQSESVDNILFSANYRTTYLKAKEKDERAQSRAMTRGVDEKRHLINLEICNAQGKDKARIVFNNEASIDYEPSCDAAKFLSTQAIPQIYTLDNKKTQYAINERPSGEVAIGYTAPNAGMLTITAARMDEPITLFDKVTGAHFDLSLGEYQFESEAGTFENRFSIAASRGATNIEKNVVNGVSVVGTTNGIYIQGANNADVSIYSLTGTTLATKVKDGLIVLPSATYIVKVNDESMKVLVK